MRCFLACFTTAKHNKRLNAPPNYHSRHVSAESLPLQSRSVEVPSTEPIVKKLEEQLSCNGETNVTTSFNNSDKNDAVLCIEEPAADVVGKNEEKSNVSSLISSKEASAALNPNPKQESEDFDLKNDGDLQESSESLFSLSIDSRKYTNGGEVGEKEVSSPMPKSGSFDQQGPNSLSSNHNATPKTPTLSNVLTPVKQNLPQLETATSNSTLHSQDKANINFDDMTSFELLCKKEKANPRPKKLLGEQIAVDTSLSSWLKGSTDSDAISSGKGRHILGALTVNQLHGQQTSQNQSKNLGTIGSFWSHTGTTVDSDSTSSSIPQVKKYAKDEGGNCESTPFEARLDSSVLQK